MPTSAHPAILAQWMAPFSAFFTRPTFQHVLTLVAGVILSPGRRTVAAALSIMGMRETANFTNFHRELNRNRWPPRALAQRLLTLLIAAFVPDGPVVIGIDETIERRWGPRIKARGIYRDPVRSSHGHFVKASGLRWISVMLLAPIPWAGRIWALPFLTALAPSERYARERGRRHKPLTDWARQLLVLIARWLPERRVIAVADMSYAAIDLLKAVRRHLTMITRLRLDARLFDPPPPRQPRQMGRPRVSGARQPSSRHPDRDAQFEHIKSKVIAAQAAGQPVISVDTKKKELIGNFRNGGTDYRPKGDPRRVKIHDFEDKSLGNVAPYGVYDVTADEGWISVGITADTAEFAVASIRTWLERMGRGRYPQARELTITADCGGSNGVRVRLWKRELQMFADESRLVLHIHHYPPRTSKWNRIEHRLFCHITQNWRGHPLTDRRAVVELIGATTTKTGPKVECALDTRIYEKGLKVSDAEFARLDITGDAFHPEWNYTIKPRQPEE